MKSWLVNKLWNLLLLLKNKNGTVKFYFKAFRENKYWVIAFYEDLEWNELDCTVYNRIKYFYFKRD